MPVINGVYLKDFPALPSAVTDANIIPIAISGNQIAYRTTVAGIVTDARVTSKLLTGLSVTGSTILATDTILQAFGKVQNQLNGKVSSVGLTMPAAFNVANSPITSAGTLAVTAAGVASQYIRGDGALGDFPTTGGGGSSVSYYLNGSVNQGTFVGNTYYEMNKTPVIGTGTDFTINANGYIAQFITDANDPASLLIPGGNWNVEMYFSASSSGGTPSFYVEVYKYDGTTFTLLGSSSATPEGITNGTAIDIYYTSVGIPETVLTITDRLAIRVYVTHSGRTITLHTEDNHLSEIVTTFSNGLTTLNGLTKQAQYFAVGSTGTDFNISSSVDTHTFNIPSASASNRGLINTGAQTLGGDKTIIGATANPTLILKNSSTGRILEVKNPGGGDSLIINNIGQVTMLDNLSIGGGSTFDMGQTMLATGSSYFQSTLSVCRNTSTQSYTIAFRTGTLGAGASPNWYIGNYSGNADFEISKYDGSSVVNTLKINTTTNLVTLLGGISATTANFTGLLTGATATFTNSSSGIGVDVTNSGSGDGIKITHSLGRAFRIESSSTGYGILINNLTASTSVPFTIQKQGSTVITMSDTGAANFTGQLTLGSTITNGTYTYTLPSATGTLALTSALSSYLPLSGGTLTGALSGTSATFSGALTAVNISNNGIYYGRANASFPATSLGYFALKTNNLDGERGGLTVQVSNATSTFIDALTLNYTGAATFSGDLTVGSASTGKQINVYSSSYGSNGLFNAYGTDGNIKLQMGGLSNTNAFIYTGAGNSLSLWAGAAERLTIASTGAATFSSSVSVGDFLRLTKASSVDIQAYTGAAYTNLNYDAASHNWQTSGGTAKMVLTSGGNVGIGTTSPSYPLHLKNATFSQLYIEGGSAADLILYNSGGSANTRTMVYRQGTGGTAKFFSANDAGTINKDNILVLDNSTGNVGIGNASPFATYALTLTRASGGAVAATSGGSGDAQYYSSSSTIGYHFYADGGGTTKLYIQNNGDVKNANNSYGAISDISLKENISDATPKLEDLLKVKIRNYNLIDDESKTKQIGVIAQELEEIFPNMITEDKLIGDDKTIKTVKYSIFVPMLIKAMQELAEQVKELTAEIDLLKGIAPIEPEPMEDLTEVTPEPIIPTDNNLE